MRGFDIPVGDKRIGIYAMKMPGRKKKCLVIHQGNTYTKYATFNNNEAADEFIDILAKLLDCDW